MSQVCLYFWAGPPPEFIEVPGRAHPGTGKREGPPPLNKKGVPSLPFID